jgi:MFS family permease
MDSKKITLTKDFWWFRGGEFLSDLGTGAHALAVAWWVLEQTGSAASMSMVLVPVTLVRLMASPLLSPLADRFSRKHLMLVADAGLILIAGLMTWMFYTNLMNMALLIGLSVLLALVSSLFAVGSQAVVPNLVDKEAVQLATQQTQALNAVSMLIGGIFGASLVALLGVTGALAVDTLTFVFSFIGIWMIRANTKPERTETKFSIKVWQEDLHEGLRTVWNVKVLFGLVLVAALLNLAFAPIQILIPYLIKETLGLTPWHVGLVETVVGASIILGSITVGVLTNKIHNHRVLILGVTIGAVALFVGGFVQAYWGFVLTCALLVMGVTWTNILVGAQASVAVPDHYRARVNTIINTIATSAMPLGLAVSGPLLDRFGGWTLLSGIALMVGVIIPLLFLVPNLVTFFNQPSEQVEGWMKETYPNAFTQ